jgi:hypothetical protein
MQKVYTLCRQKYMHGGWGLCLVFSVKFVTNWKAFFRVQVAQALISWCLPQSYITCTLGKPDSLVFQGLLRDRCESGLPDGSFSNQKSKFGSLLEVLAMEDSGIFYGHLVHFQTILYILLHCGIFCGHLVYFAGFRIVCHLKSGNPGVNLKDYPQI